ncbi:uncharacterized protein LOC131149686 [Malania oleifera]|uniref:uncharacterized protein LOC131149686 n=1 Tax=Malania oleifera TaxID=397392 RepID=UPI0025AE757D|nr:uncharacterized protein LOC131149686 [Malania oleifera]
MEKNTGSRKGRQCPPAPGLLPWLVYPQGKSLKNQIFCSVSEPKRMLFQSIHRRAEHNKHNMVIKSIPELRHRIILGSCYGWLLVLLDWDFSLFDPSTLSTIKFPSLNSIEDPICLGICTLSSPPSNPSCTVFLFDDKVPRIIFCQLNDQQWTVQNYRKQLQNILGNELRWNMRFVAAVAFDSKLYASTSTRRMMIVIEVNDSHHLKITSLGIRRPKWPKNLICGWDFLLESGGEILVAQQLYGERNVNEANTIKVHRLDFSRMTWVEVKSLDDRILFLGRNCSVSCPATETETQGNHIFFTEPEEKSLYSYNIEEASISAYMSWRDKPTPWHRPIWVMPNRRLTGMQAEAKQSDNTMKEEFPCKEDKEGNDGVEDVDQTNANTVNWSDLCFDIFSVVAKHLNLFDYMNFRAACRDFRLAAPPTNWKTASPMLKNHILSPWFMYLKKDDGVCYLGDPAHGNTFKRKNVPEKLSGAEINCSWDGRLLMSKDMESIFFFNPFTGEQGEYPRHEMFSVLGIGFSTSPTSSDCTTLVICSAHGDTGFSFIHSREMTWRYVYQINFLDFTAISNPVFLDTAFYVLGSNGNLGVIKLNMGEGHCDVLAKPERPCNSFYDGYLAECDGELLSVFVGHLGKWVEVFRLNRTAMVWVKIESLGNHMLFVSDSSSISAVAKIPEMENKIYFPRFYGETQNIIFYSLETQRYHSFGYELLLYGVLGTLLPPLPVFFFGPPGILHKYETERVKKEGDVENRLLKKRVDELMGDLESERNVLRSVSLEKDSAKHFLDVHIEEANGLRLKLLERQKSEAKILQELLDLKRKFERLTKEKEGKERSIESLGSDKSSVEKSLAESLQVIEGLKVGVALEKDNALKSFDEEKRNGMVPNSQVLSILKKRKTDTAHPFSVLGISFPCGLTCHICSRQPKMMDIRHCAIYGTWRTVRRIDPPESSAAQCSSDKSEKNNSSINDGTNKKRQRRKTSAAWDEFYLLPVDVDGK